MVMKASRMVESGPLDEVLESSGTESSGTEP